MYFLHLAGISKKNWYGNAVFAQQTKLFWRTWRAPDSFIRDIIFNCIFNWICDVYHSIRSMIDVIIVDFNDFHIKLI